MSNCTGSPNKTDFASFEATTVVLQYIMLSTPLRLSVEAHLSASLLTVEVVGLYLLLISSELLASTFSLVPFFSHLLNNVAKGARDRFQVKIEKN